MNNSILIEIIPIHAHFDGAMIFRTMLPAGTQSWILKVITNTQSFLPYHCWDAIALTLVEEHGLTPELAHQAITEAHEIVINGLFDQGA